MIFQNANALKVIFEKQGEKRWEVAKTSAVNRIEKLKKLRNAILNFQEDFYKAIWEDFHKSRFESWLCEVFPAIEEIDFAIKNLKNWMADKPANWVYFLPTTQSYSHFEPMGRVLIFAPWNYPFLLFISPIVSAIAAGNVIMAKPSQKTPRVSKFLASLIESLFDESEVAVIEGTGAEVGDELLKLPFDHVFFTGSPKVGAHIAKEVSIHHSRVTLELGGKSPTIILPDIASDVSLKDAAKKIAWGKFLNAGQTCVAPDYVLCPRIIVKQFAQAIVQAIQKMYGSSEDEIRNSVDFVHIVDSQAVKRHKNLIDDAIQKGAIIDFGGFCDVEGKFTAPTVLTEVTADMDIMQSEIFGPILPIVAYDTLDEAVLFVQKRAKPLALYVFSNDNSKVDKVLQETTSGSVCINNCIIQIENLTAPFGGVGASGTGSYHGFYGFKAFSHERNVMRQSFFNVIQIFFAPYTNKRSKIQALTEKILRFIKSI